MRVMIVVTHLHGTGHLTRALTLGRAFADEGHVVCVASGGRWPTHLRAPDVEVVQLPAVSSNGVDFTQLLDADGAPASPAVMAARTSLLIETLEKFAPDALITELFPFGRRILKDEFLALLNAAKAPADPPRIFSSVRDILAPPSKPAKVAFADDVVGDYYDAVLVHAVEDLTPLSLSWPCSAAVKTKLRYTGYVTVPAADAHPERAGTGEILVTAGGGDVGGPLFACAKSAAAGTPTHRWRCLVGGADAAAAADRLLQDAPENFVAEPARPDFRQMLHHAAASVSLCGYNTALDVLQTRCPAVFVPYDAGGEVEQTIRARALSKQPGIEMLAAPMLSPQALIDAVKLAQSAQRTPIASGQTKGAAATVAQVSEMVGETS